MRIEVPEESVYEPETSVITVTDNGSGMSAEQVGEDYLVIGRNRRAEGQEAPAGRSVMGRKGVGKLAAFGLGRTMSILTGATALQPGSTWMAKG